MLRSRQMRGSSEHTVIQDTPQSATCLSSGSNTRVRKQALSTSPDREAFNVNSCKAAEHAFANEAPRTTLQRQASGKAA